MKKIFSKKAILVAVIALVLAAATAVSLITAGKPGFVTDAVETVLKPVKIVCAEAAGMCEKLYGYMNDYDRLLAENAALRAQSAGADQEKREYSALAEENARLRELLGLAQKNNDFVFDSASILSWSSSNWESSFTISKGSANSDIAPGDAVIDSSGCVIGMVRTVAANSSTCISVIDTTFAASVDMDNVVGSCSASGDYSLMKQGKLKGEYISDSNMVFNGDSVVTSGKGGFFPQGLLVGYVDSVVSSSGGLKEYAVISPAVNLDDQLYVYIITDFNPTE